MSKIRVLIVDDEENARAALVGIIQHNFVNVEIVGEAASVPEAVIEIKKNQPDVVFLDIEMPTYLGTDLLRFFDEKEINFSIVFLTAYSEYALKAFDLAAIDYLLKPTSSELVERALQRVIQKQNEQTIKLSALKYNFDESEPKRIVINTSEGLHVYPLSEILYLKADSAYTHIYFVTLPKLTITKTLQEFSSLEDDNGFFRVNRSYLINISKVDKIVKKDGGYVLMTDGLEISASPEKRQLLASKIASKIY